MSLNKEEWEDSLSGRLIEGKGNEDDFATDGSLFEEDGCTPVQTRFVVQLGKPAAVPGLGRYSIEFINLPYIHFKGREGQMNPLEALGIRGGDKLIYGGYDKAALKRHGELGLYPGKGCRVEQVHRAPR